VNDRLLPIRQTLHSNVQQAGLGIVIPLEERWFRQDQTEASNRQFVISNPDGYLLRFCRNLGRRPAEKDSA